MAAVDAWDPGQYERFAAERAAPFHDLLSLVRPVPGGRVVDLGCGGGELTAQLHRRLEAGETLGLDSSPAMLERAAAACCSSRATSPPSTRAAGTSSSPTPPCTGCPTTRGCSAGWSAS